MRAADRHVDDAEGLGDSTRSGRTHEVDAWHAALSTSLSPKRKTWPSALNHTPWLDESATAEMYTVRNSHEAWQRDDFVLRAARRQLRTLAGAESQGG